MKIEHIDVNGGVSTFYVDSNIYENYIMIGGRFRKCKPIKSRVCISNSGGVNKYRFRDGIRVPLIEKPLEIRIDRFISGLNNFEFLTIVTDFVNDRIGFWGRKLR